MKKDIKESYDAIMDDKVNALKDLPFQVKFMSMQILAWMWSAVFGIYIIESNDEQCCCNIIINLFQ